MQDRRATDIVHHVRTHPVSRYRFGIVCRLFMDRVCARRKIPARLSLSLTLVSTTKARGPFHHVVSAGVQREGATRAYAHQQSRFASRSLLTYSLQQQAKLLASSYVPLLLSLLRGHTTKRKSVWQLCRYIPAASPRRLATLCLENKQETLLLVSFYLRSNYVINQQQRPAEGLGKVDHSRETQKNTQQAAR